MAVNDTNYAACHAVTDVIDAGKTEEGKAIDQTGMNQGSLYATIDTFITNFNLTNAKLDADAGVSGTDFATCFNLCTAALYGLECNGMHQSDLAVAMQAFETNFDALTAELDSDGGTADSDYAACTAFNMCTIGSTTGIASTGISQEAVVNYTNTVVTCFNALLAKLDADE